MDQVSFDIKKGGFLGIIGSVGSGKSTLLKVIAKLKYPLAKKESYIGRNIKINKMKYDNVIVDLKPRPVLQELIEDLTNKMLAQKRVLHMEQNNEHADYLFIEGLKSDIRLLDQVIERCYAQQELINMRDEQIIGLN